ncbi:MAG: O-antigen ligase family protein [Chloroflexota bacterium]|nr:O-antigen ligase family protein [Chloroflexota bacterium]
MARKGKALRQQRRAARGLFERSTLRQAIVLVVALKIAAIVLVFDPRGLDAFDLPKTIVSHAFAWLLAGLLVAAVLRYGHEIVPRTKLHAFVAVYVIAVLISAAFAANTYVALFGERDRYQGLTFVADMLVLYASVAVAFRGRADWAVLLGVGAAACAVSLGYAGLQVAGLDPVKWDLNTQGRPFGTLGHPDTFGELLAVAFGVALGIAAFAEARRGTLRVGSVVAVVLLLAGMGVVATRGSALGVAAAVVAVPPLALRSGRLTRSDVLRVAAIGAVVVVAGIALVFASPLGSRLRATAGGYAVQDRVVIYENALSAFKDRPVVGWGPDNFAVAYPHYQQPQEDQLHGINTFSSSAHDWILQAAATTGVVGLVTQLALVGAGVVLLFTSGLLASPLVAAPLLVGAAAYWASGLVAPNSIALDWYAWVVFGAAAALTGSRVPESSERRRPGPFAYAPTYVALAAGLFFAYGASVADREAQAAQAALNGHDVAGAIQHAQAAVAADNGRARYWSILGAADQTALRWRDAETAHGEAARRAPYVANNWVNLARSDAGQAASGDDAPTARAAALDAARRAIAVSPYEPVPHLTLAQIAIDFTGDQQLAQSEVARAIALYQDDPSYDKTAVLIASKSTDPKAAVTFLQGLLRWKDTAALRVGIAQEALKGGDREVARENAQKALQLDPKNTDARSLLTTLGG